MTIELTMLAWATALGLVHAVSTGQLALAQHGVAYSLSPRDEQKPLPGVPGRISRAFANYMQTFPFFAAAVLAAHAADRHSWLTTWGVQLYFWARVIYIPLYASGTSGPRTVAFLVSVVGIAMLLAALALG